MASTITITCPECDRQLKASSELLGKMIRCKGCGATFAAPKAVKSTSKATKPAKGSTKKAEDEDEDASPYTMREEYLGRRCPDCANAIGDDDRICLHCGYDTLTRVKASTRKVQEITGLDIFLWLLPGILCALVVFSLLGACAFYWVAINRETFGEVWYDFLGSLGMKVYVSLICLYIIYVAGKFAVKRLILNYMPPEIELKLKSK